MIEKIIKALNSLIMGREPKFLFEDLDEKGERYESGYESYSEPVLVHLSPFLSLSSKDNTSLKEPVEG